MSPPEVSLPEARPPEVSPPEARPSEASPPAPFPWLLTVAALTLTAAAVAGLAWVGAERFAPGEGAVKRAAMIAVCAVWGVYLITLPPVAIVSARGPAAAGQAFLAAMAGRMLACLGGGLIAVLLFRLHTRGFLLAMVAAYLPLLAVEVTILSLWMRRTHPAPPAPTPPTPTPPTPASAPGD